MLSYVFFTKALVYVQEGHVIIGSACDWLTGQNLFQVSIGHVFVYENQVLPFFAISNQAYQILVMNSQKKINLINQHERKKIQITEISGSYPTKRGKKLCVLRVPLP